MDGLQLIKAVDAECGKGQVYIGDVNRVIGFAVPKLEYVLIGGKENLVAVVERGKFFFVTVNGEDDAFRGVFPGDAQA